MMKQRFIQAVNSIGQSLGVLGDIEADDSGKIERLADLNAQIKELTRERDSVISDLKGSIQFEQILPGNENSALHGQLRKNERVHPVGTTKKLVRERVGNVDSNKRCFGRVVRDGKSEEVTAGIFTALVQADANGGALSFSDIPGDINGVKGMPVEPFLPEEGARNVVYAILYTISSNSENVWDKGGRLLAGAVYEFLNAEAEQRGYEVVISTLSPVRGFSKWLSEHPDYVGRDVLTSFSKEVPVMSDDFMRELRDEGEQEKLRALLMQYLLTDNDLVLNFHLGNGACIGDLKLNLDNPTDWFMVNYVYPNSAETLVAQQRFYSETKKRFVAPHLMPLVGYDMNLQSRATVILDNPLDAVNKAEAGLDSRHIPNSHNVAAL